MSRVRIGLIGAGGIATIADLPTCQAPASYLRFDFQDATVEVEHHYGYDNSFWRWVPAPHLYGRQNG